eukprot:GEMP01029154.1.p1 GENE.GEMP01029154.1~~GEMP01029154.1.p1  ORF type:complete len:316 (+),score=77.29 GEMP01029154.1:205-1152(+)
MTSSDNVEWDFREIVLDYAHAAASNGSGVVVEDSTDESTSDSDVERFEVDLRRMRSVNSDQASLEQAGTNNTATPTLAGKNDLARMMNEFAVDVKENMMNKSDEQDSVAVVELEQALAKLKDRHEDIYRITRKYQSPSVPAHPRVASCTREHSRQPGDSCAFPSCPAALVPNPAHNGDENNNGAPNVAKTADHPAPHRRGDDKLNGIASRPATVALAANAQTDSTRSAHPLPKVADTTTCNTAIRPVVSLPAHKCSSSHKGDDMISNTGTKKDQHFEPPEPPETVDAPSDWSLWSFISNAPVGGDDLPQMDAFSS